LLRVRQVGRPGVTRATGGQHCVRTLNGLLGHPQQSSLRPFPHKRGRKLWGLPLVTHGGSDPCQIPVWETFSKIVVVWHSHPFSSSSVLASGASLIENRRPRSCSSVLVVPPLPSSCLSSSPEMWVHHGATLYCLLEGLSLTVGVVSCGFIMVPLCIASLRVCCPLSVLSLDLDSPHCVLIACLEL
jgi:hypothetical protein